MVNTTFLRGFPGGRRRERISILYITRDIASARYVADRLVVMYAGQVATSDLGGTEPVALPAHV